LLPAFNFYLLVGAVIVAGALQLIDLQVSLSLLPTILAGLGIKLIMDLRPG